MSRQLGRTSTSPPHLSQASLRANAGISVPAGQRETANQGSRVHKHCLGRTPGVCARPARSCFPMSKVFRPSFVRSYFNSSDGKQPTAGGADRQRLAPAASSLRQTTTAATAPAASTPSTPSTASTASPRELHAGLRCSGVFLVEDIESRQADVRDFLLTESNHGTRCGVLRCYISSRRSR